MTVQFRHFFLGFPVFSTTMEHSFSVTITFKWLHHSVSWQTNVKVKRKKNKLWKTIKTFVNLPHLQSVLIFFWFSMAVSSFVFALLKKTSFVLSRNCCANGAFNVTPLIRKCFMFPCVETENTKQLSDEVFVISGIIKLEVSVISRAEGRGW